MNSYEIIIDDSSPKYNKFLISFNGELYHAVIDRPDDLNVLYKGNKKAGVVSITEEGYVAIKIHNPLELLLLTLKDIHERDDCLEDRIEGYAAKAGEIDELVEDYLKSIEDEDDNE